MSKKSNSVAVTHAKLNFKDFSEELKRALNTKTIVSFVQNKRKDIDGCECEDTIIFDDNSSFKFTHITPK